MRALVTMVCAIASIFTLPADSSAQWVAEVLGPDVIPFGINDHGHIVGGGGPGPFVWTAQTGIRRFLGDSDGVARDINNRGDIVGVAQQRGFLWNEATGYRDLGDFIPAQINDHGVIAGSCVNTDVGERPCVWSKGTAIVIDVHGDGSGSANGINDAGDVVGEAHNRPFLLTHDGTLRPLEVPTGASLAIAIDVNDRGHIVGAIDSGASMRLALWGVDGHLQRFFPADEDSADEAEFFPAALNDRGMVVGNETEFSPRSFVWVIGMGLSSLSDDADATEANDINLHGDAVGSVQIGVDNATFGVVWRYRPRLRVTTPNDPSHWGLDTRHPLAWTYTGLASQLKIEISRGGEEDWELIDIVNRRGGGSQNYSWAVTAPTTDTARLRVSAIGDPDAIDVNDADIRIAPAGIEVLRPRSRTMATFGSTQTIFFSHNLGASVPVAIDVSQDGGRSWRTVVERTLTRGSTSSSFFWAVDLTPTTRAQVRVRALDGSGASGVSEAFTVTAASLGTRGVLQVQQRR
jgi:hypothetical protein